MRRACGTRTLAPEAIVEHLDRLYRFARGRRGSHEHAEDLVQETYARVLQKPRLLHSDDGLATCVARDHGTPGHR